MAIAIGIRDFKRIGKAIATNLIARLTPGAYVHMTGETGRGLGEETAEDVVAYFRECFDDYFAKLRIPPSEVEAYLAGKRLLEYGPGDVPGVAILMLAHGAASVVCVDRFPLLNNKPGNVAIVRALIGTLSDAQRRRVEHCLARADNCAGGWRPECLRYRVDASGLSRLRNEVDFIYSRAVLEHVNDLQATFADMKAALRPDGIAVHLVDLKSHGLHRGNPLDFLVWPQWLWHWMYGYKGVPNRWRADKYREALRYQEFEVRLMEPTALAEAGDLAAVRPHLASCFRGLNDEDLRWLGFWLICVPRKAAA
jgi:SAM-dependent methyltransferase